jgi:NitT/TauT family transport system substrate-binding protein
MRIGTDIWVGNEVLAVAEHSGRLPLALIRRVEFSSNQEILRALRNGVVEAGSLMLDETLIAAHDGTDLVIIAAVDTSVGADAVIGQQTLADLEGSRVGLQINSGGLQILRRALSVAKLTAKDVTVVNVPPDRHLMMFASKQVDAVVTYDPMRTQLLSRGGVDLYNSAAIAGDVINVLVVRREYLEAHPNHSRALLDAWWSGLTEFREVPASRAWAAGRVGLTPDELEQALSKIEFFDESRSRQMLRGSEASLPETARRFHEFMRENGRLTADVDVDSLFRVPAGWTR